MADKDFNLNQQENLKTNDALDSFLSRESSVQSKKNQTNSKQKRLSRSLLWVIIGCIVVVVISGIVLLLNFLPNDADTSELPSENSPEITLTVDKKGEHQAQLITNEKGELEDNGAGSLIEYTPSQIKQIDIENESGSYTITADTPVTVDEETGEENSDATVYTLLGYEDLDLQSGGPDTVADDVAAISFTSVADPTGKNASDFGFDNPRSIVKTQYTDDTSSTIIVGDDAPSQLGTYVMFGDSKAVYLVDSESVDGFLFSVLDLITLTVNDSASDTDNAEFKSLTLSGTAFDKNIKIKPNNDKAIDSSYVMTEPEEMFISEVEAANISGAIRGLYADKVVCVNPSDSQLEKYGLLAPYASLTAVYPDQTIHLKASQPKDDNVYIIADSDIIYQMKASAVPWVNTTYNKLVPDIVIDPNFSSLTEIVVTDESGTYEFDVTTVTETVTNTDGEEEEVENTTATYNGKALDSDNFTVFYQNIANMQNAGNTSEAPSGTPVLTIKLSYSTSRAADVIDVYKTGNTKYIATLNGKVQSLVYKSYCTKFSQCVQDLIRGKTVGSF